jgi:hypothetical protein
MILRIAVVPMLAAPATFALVPALGCAATS